MWPWARITRIGVAAAAAVLLFAGVLNLRAAIGSGDDQGWYVDPAEPTALDGLVGAPLRQPTDLDQQILAAQETLRADSDRGETATALGLAYLQKARETGDPSYYPKADALFERALKRNGDDFAAMAGMGALALARHDFSAALDWGERAAAINPHYPAAHGVVADALVELGRYGEAVAATQRMVDLRPDLASFARVSYVRELMGDVPGALEAMERAAQAGVGRAENVAWTQAQSGNLLFTSGDLIGAEARYAASLRTVDGYVYGLAGMGRVAAARGDVPAAIAFYADAVRRMPLPEFVIALGEVYEAAGMPAEAQAQFALVGAMVRLYAENGVDTDVELARFLADHGDDPEQAVAMAETGYAARPSIKTADVLAWALHKAGRHAEAQPYALEALRLGTRDATLFFHAGMIDAALGNTEAATGYLSEALAINPFFSPLYAAHARETLSRLQGRA